MKKKLGILFAFVMGLSMALSAWAVTLPDLPRDVMVVDDAGVLSSSTEKQVQQINDQLAESGANIGVLTVDYTGTATTEEYAYEAFNTWGIGDSKKNNGVLLLLVIDGDDYWCTTGTGLNSVLPVSTISTILSDYCEPGFADRDYDKAVTRTVQAIGEQLIDYYGISAGTSDPVAGYQQQSSSNMGGMFTMTILILVVAVLLIIVLPGRRRYRRPPPPPSPMSGFGAGYVMGSMAARPRRRRPPPPPRWRTPPPPPPGSMGGFGGPRGGMSRRPSSMGSFGGPRGGMGGGRSMGGGAGRSGGGRSSMGGGRTMGGGAGRR